MRPMKATIYALRTKLAAIIAPKVKPVSKSNRQAKRLNLTQLNKMRCESRATGLPNLSGPKTALEKYLDGQ